MCGIAGFVDPKGSLGSARTLQTLSAALAHRGPDGEGFFQDGPFGLAHRRLAIIDLTDGGAQPMRVEHLVVIFNGEIYNYLELRAQLLDLGHRFVGTSDTEVLARCYLQWGSDCVEHLRGMWAFAILDVRSRTLTCARDPFGIKPFYYASHLGAFVFASEPQALLLIGVPARANPDVIAPYIALGLTDHSPHESFFAGIHKLRPGETILVDGEAQTRTLAVQDPFATSRHLVSSNDQFAACLEESVRLHLRSDVPVGTCLSGGLDSSTVAALAARAVREQGGSDFCAVTASSLDPATDEREYARAVVEHCNLRWRVVQPTELEFSAEVEDCLRIQGEPTGGPSVYFQYCVMKEARAAGLKVMLDGQGADEILCGYDRYVPVYLAETARAAGLAAALRAYSSVSRDSRRGRRGTAALSAYVLLPALRLRMVASRLKYMRREYVERALAVVEQICATNRSLLDARKGDLSRYSLPGLLRYEDRNSMAHSLEARVPYVDRMVVPCALALPQQGLYDAGFSKYALRQIAARELPPGVAWRRSKIGFEPPTRRWMGAIGDRIQRQIGESSLLRHMFTGLPDLSELAPGLDWRLFNLSVWERTFSVSGP